MAIVLIITVYQKHYTIIAGAVGGVQLSITMDRTVR